MNAQDLHAIAALDLEPIKVKLMHQESGEGWTLERANAVEFEYRRFLILMKKFPNEQTAPLVDVDTFWHYHILDTMKYAADCDAVFGHFLHHFPYIGLRGEDDEAAHIRVGLRMKQLYEDTFGEDYVRKAAQADTAHSGVAAVSFAHSGLVGAQFAHSGVIGAQFAHSGVVGAKFAHSGVVGAQVAHSGVVGASAAQAEAAIIAAQQSSFYQQRPRLTA
ncbi:glycine-rich domain-containing protein-like [Pseudoduganella sp. FT55W]|uniref:Glycine-rich domain-containing protein-like n=1 Tax=Duganella rivi TaxID=2666083 RepID=A0A7X4GN36_9BURK|nr:glycine-rich domain-containing protein-like [Duganella rivi]MYM65549.1 glycine-rich domain-containing protein-like [Duganella rivi]